MVGTFRRLAQSLVGASNTTSTSVPSVASRSINERSAISTSWITLITMPTGTGCEHPVGVRLQGTACCPKVQDQHGRHRHIPPARPPHPVVSAQHQSPVVPIIRPL